MKSSTTAASGSYATYPLVMTISIGLHLALSATGVPVQSSAYICIALGALTVTVLERAQPHRSEWQGRAEDFRNDALYLLLVQSVLPAVLALSLGVLALRGMHSLGVAPARYWPGSWPVPAQALLMLLAADFLRYWLHVAKHRYAPLWRLHAVHHSPARLYWLNVARFHPLEKLLQYLLDALPFIVLGVSEPVLALYFVFYAVNGFFQHSNIDVRLGPLNWVISGPELHRWHHSRVTTESNTNYGNNFIVWDVVFGTRFLPEERVVGDLGLHNSSYPQGFVAQLKTPFVRQLENTSRPLPKWTGILASWVIVWRMQLLRCGAWRQLVQASRHPRQVQEQVLRRILRANAGSRFGREHEFAQCKDVDTFRRAVPVQDYESLRPYVERQMNSGVPELSTAAPVLYARTSGTTGEPKYVPVLERSLRDHRTCQRLSAFVQYNTMPEAFQGRLLGMVSPAVEETLATGIPCGSTSGFLYRSMSKVLRSRYVVPEEVFAIPDYELKYEVVLRLAVVDPGITYMASANPSTFLKLADVLRERRLELLADVEAGSLGRMDELDEGVRRALRSRLGCTLRRMEQLREILGRPAPTLGEVWPHLTLVSTWTGGSCGIALESLRKELPEHTRIAELGYLSSEFPGTITVDLNQNRGVPTLLHHFFEFVEVEQWDRDEPAYLLIDELEPEGEYYVLVTTVAGLYRYFMNDVIRVTGTWNATPTIAFVRKGRGVTSITGEKLSESQLIDAVQIAARDWGASPPFFIALAEPREARYALWIAGLGDEVPDAEFAQAVESHLCRLNMEYAQKRASGRLGALAVQRLNSGAADAYKKYMLAEGQRESQFKVQPLQYVEDCHFPFEDHAQRSMGGTR